MSEGPFPAKLPDLVGKDQATAQQLITAAGLTVGGVTPQFDETVPAGVVMSWKAAGQTLAPGTEVTKGTTIDLVVSQGPQPRTIPKLIGQPPEVAIAQLQQLGLVPEPPRRPVQRHRPGRCRHDRRPARRQAGRPAARA